VTLFAVNHRIALTFVIATLASCGDRDGELRGAVSKSADGGTYFGVADNDGGGCGSIQVDGQVWPHAVNKVAPIAPGRHTIKICSEMPFEVAAGTTYLFDYWGP
jgi:hypothetical protein